MSERFIGTIRILNFLLSNPIPRAIFRSGMRSCGEEGVIELEHALKIFSGLSRPRNLRCSLYYHLIDAIFRSASAIFGIKKSSLSKYFRETVTRRGLVSVLKGIAKYGVTRPQILDAPFLVVWNYTNSCNLRCMHCYQSAGKKSEDELTTEERMKVVDELYDAGVVALAFSGGEPLMRRDFFEVAEKASSKGIYLALASNGTLITKDIANRLVDSGVSYVEISLDSSKPEVHDRFRGVRGSYIRAIEGIKNCVEAGIYTCVAQTVTKLNLNDVEDTIRLAKDLGASRFLLFNFIPEGRGKAITDLDLSPEERESLLMTLTKKAMGEDMEILSTAPQYARVSLQTSEGKIIAPTHFYLGGSTESLRVLAEFIGGCGAGRLYCALQPDGDVTPCVFIKDIVVGNVRNKGFLDMWQNDVTMRLLRDRSKLKGHCRICEYKYICGGCRARALAYSGDIMGPDPGCVNNLEYYNLLIRDVLQGRMVGLVAPEIRH